MKANIIDTLIGFILLAVALFSFPALAGDAPWRFVAGSSIERSCQHASQGEGEGDSGTMAAGSGQGEKEEEEEEEEDEYEEPDCD
ncbi:MAG: hypothetical protein ISN28_10450 [Ectothiorhodospiraceae bacterium AqS1]|nr:hypothetical protein [Ectothiorhodospiraceae bacterium AqS1]